MRDRVEKSARKVAVLFVDDDEAMRGLVWDALQDLGFQVALAADGGEALELAMSGSPDVIITDLRMPEGGLSFVARLHEVAPRTPVIVLSAFGDAEVQRRARALGAAAYLSKPVRMAELAGAVTRILAPAPASASDNRTLTGE